jgi:hypothetical protein
MSLKDLWNKTSFARKAEEDKIKKTEDETLRAKVREEIKPEIERIKMEKIKEEELARARGTYVEPEKKKNPLAMLGEEFKSSSIGSNDQMEKILGKSGTQAAGRGNRISGSGSGSQLMSTEKLLDTVTSSKKIDTNKDFGSMLGKEKVQKERDIPGMLGRGRGFRDDYGAVIGFERKKEDVSEKIGNNKEANEAKLRKMLGK